MAASGSQAVLEIRLGGESDWVDVSRDGQGFTGFDTTVTRTNEQVPGAGPARFRDTGHTSGTVSFTVSDTSVTRGLLWSVAGSRLEMRFSPEGASSGDPFTVYSSYVDVTKTAEGQGLCSYEVTGPWNIAPVVGRHS